MLGDQFYSEMCDIISDVLSSGQISEVHQKPRCIHSLGGVEKSNGSLRPITDCSMPNLISINNYMDTTFSYNSINMVVAKLNREDYMCVVDLKSAHRSINTYGEHTTF